MKSWIHEPLLHFLMVGSLLFAIHGWLNPEQDNTLRAVHITTADVTWLKETWVRQWQRPPSEQELRGLVADYLKEDLLAREAKELGLDENDTIVRRRLAQKMEFLLRDAASFAEPGEKVLRRFYLEQRAEYKTAARISFTQHFFKTGAAARRGLAALEADMSAEVGDPSLLERDYRLADEQTVASLFGPRLAEQLFALGTGRWHGPIASSYGFHLVQVTERLPGQQQAFEQVQARVRDDWHRQQQVAASERFFDLLLAKYDLVMDEEVKSLIGPLVAMTP
ncbi:peptidyl-prolyl cis-trans isomerase [Porticoccus sp.]